MRSGTPLSPELISCGVLGGMMKMSARVRSVVASTEWTMPVNSPVVPSTNRPEKASATIAAK